ncbi:MAG: hypothetical protein ACK55Z_18410 [bacterium]
MVALRSLRSRPEIHTTGAIRTQRRYFGRIVGSSLTDFLQASCVVTKIALR